MSKVVIIYNSQTGFTKKYANWLAEALQCECVELASVKKRNFSEFETIIFGGWACAGRISKIKWFKDNMAKWHGKRLAAFCVGASPIENPEIEIAMKNWFKPEDNVKTFYCPGGFAYNKMSGASKFAMKMFINALKAKKNKTEDDEKQIEMISSSYDISDPKYIEPIVKWINEEAG